MSRQKFPEFAQRSLFYVPPPSAGLPRDRSTRTLQLVTLLALMLVTMTLFR